VALEIERKFLVADQSWRSQVDHSERIVDGLLATSKGPKVRVRLYADRATLAIKTRKKGRVRSEFEYEIPLDDARQILEKECGRTILAKTRHIVLYAGKPWEVDEYEAPLAGIVLAEVELSTADEELSFPPWLGREVTGDPAFSKGLLLAKRGGQPFRTSEPLVVRAKSKRSKSPGLGPAEIWD
jgi:CYTH domain-containing protein